MSKEVLYLKRRLFWISRTLVAPGSLLMYPDTHASGGVDPELEIQFGTSQSLLSPAYMTQQTLSCRMLLMHFMVIALALAWERAGRSIAARMAIIAMTTSNSIKVKPAPLANLNLEAASSVNATWERAAGFGIAGFCTSPAILGSARLFVKGLRAGDLELELCVLGLRGVKVCAFLRRRRRRLARKSGLQTLALEQVTAHIFELTTPVHLGKQSAFGL
jgi:hypothetical protein